MKIKSFIFLMVMVLIKSNIYCQKQVPDTFKAAFNEIIYAFPDNFEALKGKLDTSVKNIMIWKSKVKLPDAESGFIVFDKNIFKDEKFTEFSERIIKTPDKKRAWKRYLSFITKISETDLSCCNLKEDSKSDVVKDTLKTNYSTYFNVESVKNENFTKRFTFIRIQIEFKPSIDGEYEVDMRISDPNYY